MLVVVVVFFVGFFSRHAWRSVRGSPLERSWYSLAMEFQHLTWLHQRHPMSNGRGNGKALALTGHQGPSKRWRVTENLWRKKKKKFFLGTCDVETGDRRTVGPSGHVLSKNVNTVVKCSRMCWRVAHEETHRRLHVSLSPSSRDVFTAVCGLSDDTTGVKRFVHSSPKPRPSYKKKKSKAF